MTTADKIIEKVDELIGALSDTQGDASLLDLPRLRMLRDNPDTQSAIQMSNLLVNSQYPYEREVASEILEIVCTGTPREDEMEAACRILSVLSEDSELQVAASALLVLGQLHVPGVEDLLIRFSQHRSPHLRARAASVLWLHPTPGAASSLIELARDEDSSVRGWAVMALGAVSVDTPEIERALLTAARDPEDEVRGEAFRALADRHHPQIVPLLQDYFRSSDTIGRLAVVAAETVASPELYDALLELRDWWDVDPEILAAALNSCGLVASPGS